MTRGHLVVAGHSTIDNIHQPNGRILPETPGGAAAYATLGAVMYGARVTLLTLLGDDYPFDRFLAGLAGYGTIDTTHVRWDAPRSIHNDAWYRADGVRTFDIESWEVMDHLTPTPADLKEEIVRDAHVLLMPGTLSIQLEAVRHLRMLGRPVAVDSEIHYFPTEDKKRLLHEAVAAANLYLPSIEHLQLLFDNPSGDVDDYAEQLAALACPAIVVKHGAEGSVVFDFCSRQCWHVPAFHDVQIEDVTGAGDGFAGGLMAALADGCGLIDAACWGTATASYVIEGIGALIPPHFSPAGLCARCMQIRERVTEQESQPSWERKIHR